ncbi:hypothetical protein niasHS_001196 [Heterodera schachtii]|uniref:RING-type domain-containing protein n=1 Tax=Heterodera schachtii TaxID=97005 RepID=A0ABD2KPM6_HETSC
MEREELRPLGGLRDEFVASIHPFPYPLVDDLCIGSVLKGREPYGSFLLGREFQNQLDCFCLEPLYPPPNAPPDERFQAVVLPCCTGVSHFACIARQLRQTAGVRLGGTCPYCRRRAFAEDAVATERWAALVRQHNKHMPNAAEEELRFIADIVNARGLHRHFQQQQQHIIIKFKQYNESKECNSNNNKFKRAADGQARELRIHWRYFPYRDDTFELEQAPQIHAAWLQVHDLGYTPPHNFQFPERPQPWMSTVRSAEEEEAQNVPRAPAEEAMEEEEDHHQNLPGAQAAAIPPPQAAEEEGNQIQMEAVPAAIQVILIDDDIDDEILLEEAAPPPAAE